MQPSDPSVEVRGAGFWLAVLGPDGSGKSTVLERLERELAGDFEAVRRHHFRPHTGRRGADHPPATDPHGRDPRGPAASAAKLAVWWADYWVGYLTAIRPALRRRHLVLFDRYFDDLLVDPRRYRFRSPMRLARQIVRWIPRPDLVVVLDAPVPTLRERKREVSEAETTRQRNAYIRLAVGTPEARVVDAGQPVDDVVAAIVALVHACLHPAPGCEVARA